MPALLKPSPRSSQTRYQRFDPTPTFFGAESMRRLRHGFARILSALLLLTPASFAQKPVTARTPATPLVAHDPYFSLWSFADSLAAAPTRHWTGSEQQLNGFIRIDGLSLRFMGQDETHRALPQVLRAIWPTRTVYEFEASGIHLTATFFTPALVDNLEVLSRPVTYLTWTASSVDGRSHSVQLYIDSSAQLAVDNEHEPVVWGTSRVGDLTVMHVGTGSQAVLGKAGDNLRIDWGWELFAIPSQPRTELAIIGEEERNKYLDSGAFATGDDLAMPRATRNNLPLLAVRFDLGDIAGAPVSRRAMLAYDDIAAIEFFHRALPAYWRRNGQSMAELLETAERDEVALRRQAEAFDKKLVSDLEAAGGAHYAELAILAYRQTIAAHKLVADVDGTPLLFSKENFSNGCIDTVDVTYPSAPLFLLLNPRLAEAQLRPIMEYASLPRWHWPFAPHDLGTYPLANGQVYGGGEQTEEDQMPIEESGNILILVAAIARAEGNASFASQYWALLSRWAAYLEEKGFDPENQLSTDDFAGHLAHNANLSIKAIVALGSYSQLATMLGKNDIAARTRQASEGMVSRWLEMASDGDHTKLAFDRPTTWSQKYNLVWDRILGLNLFPTSLAEEEIRFYLRHQNPFGLPLDNRKSYTKLDWITWSATLATRRQDFEALIDPLYRYMTESPSRVPLSDWFETTDGSQVGFQARSVVGGVYIKMLSDPEVWRKWSKPQNAESRLRESRR